MGNEPGSAKINYFLTFGAFIVIILIVTAYFVFFPKINSFNKNTPAIKNAEVGDETQNLKTNNQEAIYQAQNAMIKKVRPIDSTDHYIGSLSAPVQLIIYDDFECPFCLQFHDTIDQIRKNFSDKVVVAFRHFPLTIHTMAVSAALASECASEQGKFWEMYDKLFADNKNGKMSPEQFKQDAADLKLDKVKFNQCLDMETPKNKVQEQMIEARNFGVTGTPASFINGQPLAGAYPYEDFTDATGAAQGGMKSIIEKLLK
jgi:protein-disulfide isomerase